MVIFRSAIILALCMTRICAASPSGPSDPLPLPDMAACVPFTPWGVPTAADGRHLIVICHTAYITAVNMDRKVPDWVAWTISPEHAIGCLDRTDNFAPDPYLPVGQRAAPKDYAMAIQRFDKGHFAPAQDFSWSLQPERESFYMSNMSPQAKGLNEQGWEEIEAETRDWARDGRYGTLVVFDGPLYGHHPERIGPDGVAVPAAYWKIVVSPSTGKALAFVMTNLGIEKAGGNLRVSSINEITRLSGLTIPLPTAIDRTHVALPWPADTAAFTKAKKAACASHS